MIQSPLPDPNDYESLRFFHRWHLRRREHQLSDQFRLHLMGAAHCVVGPEWGAGGAMQSDRLHHIDIGLGGLREIEHHGRRHVMRPGDVWFLPCNTPVRLNCEEKGEAVFFAISCEWLPGIDPLMDWIEREPRFAGTCDLAEWRGWHERKDEAGMRELLHLRGLLVSWVAAALPELEELLERHLHEKTQFTAVFNLIQNHLGADLNLADLAAAHGSTARVFSKKFTRCMGVHPSDYLTSRINHEALHWVGNSELRLKEIATKLKFSDEFYFSRFFKRHNGVSPMEYRRHLRKVGTGGWDANGAAGERTLKAAGS